MFQEVRIAPSILSADFMHLADQVSLIEEAGAGFVHVDVMDGHFVPNLTIGVPIVKQLKKITALPLDVHLMIDNPDVQLPWYLDAGADLVCMHTEAFPDLESVIAAIEMAREAGVRVAMAVKPKTSVFALAEIIPLLDMVLVMSVEPGFSGQSYIEGSDSKVARVAEMARTAGVEPLIEVDGGMGVKTVGGVCAAGADVIVAGNAVYAAPDPAKALRELKAAAEKARLDALAELAGRAAGEESR